MPPQVEEVVGSVDAIAEALVVRLLLQRREGQYAFAHRIIGEALAAEALDEIGVRETLLDAVVPRRDDTLSGARSDWLVPLAFLLGRNAAWRAAVGERDPVTAARSVPNAAPLAERRQAAQQIWETYRQWRIWIWDYDRPDLVEDAEALGRLLNGAGMGDEVQAVRAGLHDDSAQVQGNAVRVLSRVNPEGFEDELARVLRDDSLEPVVRRQAAIAARDIGAVALLPLIVERAVAPADSAEGQDCSLCALELAGEDHLVETAIQLARSREGNAMAQSRIRERGSTSDILRFLKAYAETQTRHDVYSSDTELLREVIARLADDG
jgi:hypothetical protein